MRSSNHLCLLHRSVILSTITCVHADMSITLLRLWGEHHVEERTGQDTLGCIGGMPDVHQWAWITCDWTMQDIGCKDDERSTNQEG